jgi:alkylation response protein AidB-like acyl-CoA dehydrogenase
VPDELVRALCAGDEFFANRDRALAAAAGGALYAVAISEAGPGSRLSHLSTTYRPHGDGFHVQGEKSACSAAGHAAAYLVAARAARATGEGGDDDGEPTVSYFLVPAGPGVEPVGSWDPVGMRATASRGLHLDTVVSPDALLGVEGVAVLLAYATPQWLVASYAAVYAGVARSAVDHARHLLGQRHGARVPAAARARLGRADADAASAALAVEHAARLVDGAPGEPETNRWLYRAKLLAGDAAMAVTASLTEACGLRSLGRGDPLERLYRDARLGAIMPPASDVCADVLGAEALGLDPRTACDDPPW